ncbi:hypothetical protein [Aestuariivirga sp.]|jgi:hypothetical protein|uniref:hypothetical protein n=1 Tax=Aestuariivirga sp. TaxID=2650926 RepID=UPI003784C21D
MTTEAINKAARHRFRSVCPIARIEVIPLVVPEVDRDGLDGLASNVIVKIFDDEGRYGFGETDAPPDIIKAFIETATMHGCCRTIPETLICEDPKQFGVAVFQGIVHIRRPS